MTRRTVDQHAATIAKAVMNRPKKQGARWAGIPCERYPNGWKEPKPTTIICDHDAEGRMVLERELGLPTKNANKKVTEGIQAVQKRLRPAGDDKPRMFFLRDAVLERDKNLEEAKLPCSTIDEITGYIWELTSKEIKEVPRKQDDHGMDSMRYYIAERDLRGTFKVRFL
jgi:phage terminase large subunit